MSKLWNAIKDLAADAASLDVTTLQGEITFKVGTGASNPKTIAMKDLFNNLKLSAADTSTAKVVALTHVSLDKDTVMVVGENPDPVLIQRHQEAVKDATAARTAVVKILAEAFGFKTS